MRAAHPLLLVCALLALCAAPVQARVRLDALKAERERRSAARQGRTITQARATLLGNTLQTAVSPRAATLVGAGRAVWTQTQYFDSSRPRHRPAARATPPRRARCPPTARAPARPRARPPFKLSLASPVSHLGEPSPRAGASDGVRACLHPV